MTSIPEFMTAKHRECDEFFIAAENAITQNIYMLTSGIKSNKYIHPDLFVSCNLLTVKARVGRKSASKVIT